MRWTVGRGMRRGNARGKNKARGTRTADPLFILAEPQFVFAGSMHRHLPANVRICAARPRPLHFSTLYVSVVAIVVLPSRSDRISSAIPRTLLWTADRSTCGLRLERTRISTLMSSTVVVHFQRIALGQICVAGLFGRRAANSSAAAGRI